MAATYVTTTALPSGDPDTDQSAADQLAATYQKQADMFSSLALFGPQQGINVVITGLSLNVDGTITVTTHDPIPVQLNPEANLGLIRTA